MVHIKYDMIDQNIYLLRISCVIDSKLFYTIAYSPKRIQITCSSAFVSGPIIHSSLNKRKRGNVRLTCA